MNKDLLKPFRKEIIEYCKKNGLQFEKVIEFPKCGNDDVLFVQYHDPNKGQEGLNDNAPAEVILRAERQKDGSITIMPGDNINKYLAS